MESGFLDLILSLPILINSLFYEPIIRVEILQTILVFFLSGLILFGITFFLNYVLFRLTNHILNTDKYKSFKIIFVFTISILTLLSVSFLAQKFIPTIEIRSEENYHEKKIKKSQCIYVKDAETEAPFFCIESDYGLNKFGAISVSSKPKNLIKKDSHWNCDIWGKCSFDFSILNKNYDIVSGWFCGWNVIKTTSDCSDFRMFKDEKTKKWYKISPPQG